MSYFGTDGLRTKAGQWPLVPDALTLIGYEIGILSKGPVIFGRDTRLSGQWILDALSSGVLSAQKEVWDLGVCPTPVVARVTAKFSKGLGVVISASHNPAFDNGVKVLNADGSKATSSLEKKLESVLSAGHVIKKLSPYGAQRKLCRWLVDEDQQEILSRFSGLNLKGVKIAIDTAHGAAWEIAPFLLMELGAQVVQIGAEPNGKNINQGCGSLHLRKLKSIVKEHQCALGFAFDGDADRCLMIDQEGHVLDGDAIMAILVSCLKIKGGSRNKKVTGTVMTNGGLEEFIKEKKFQLHRTSVGDKYISAYMKKTGAPLGGENSGHIIIARHGLIGDGCVTMLAVLETLEKVDFFPDQLIAQYQPWPQILVNVPVKKKIPFEKNSRINKAKENCLVELEGHGRLLLRYSGTEPLARVMVEGACQRKVKKTAHQLAEVIEKELG